MSHTLKGVSVLVDFLTAAILTYFHHQGKLSPSKGVAPGRLDPTGRPRKETSSKEASMAFTPYILAFLALFSHQVLFWWLDFDSRTIPSRASAERRGRDALAESC